jgi:hypothetical protein
MSSQPTAPQLAEGNDESRPWVTIEDPPRMNLLGLILSSILERNLEKPELQQRAEKLRAEVAVQAGDMAVTVAFQGGPVLVRRGRGEARPRASVQGSLGAFTKLALGGGMVGPVLSGKLKPGGSLLLLLRIRKLLQA